MAEPSSAPAPDIFVGGSPRAGTTALQLMLCQCAGTNPMIGEAEHFFGLFKLYDDVLGDFDIKTGHYMSRAELAAYHQGLALDYLETMRRKFGGGTRLVLKAAWWSQYLHHMAVMIENARFIVIVRDPLDIAASYMAAGKRNEAKTGQNNFPPQNLAKIARVISIQYAAMFNNKQKFGARIKAIKYENLVRGQVDLAALGDFLSLPDLPAVAAKTDNGKVDFNAEQGGHFFSELWGKELNPSRIGRHKDMLSSAEIAIVKEGTDSLRNNFGYA